MFCDFLPKLERLSIIIIYVFCNFFTKLKSELKKFGHCYRSCFLLFIKAHFKWNFSRNRIEKYSDDIHNDQEDINEYFHDVIEDGGNVAAKFDENGKVRVLLVQTIVQLEGIDQVRPNVFFTDTTFSTNSQEYKLYLPTNVSTLTGETEVACYIFLATEQQQNVTDGINMFLQPNRLVLLDLQETHLWLL